MGVHVKVAGAWQEIGTTPAVAPVVTWADLSGGTVTTYTDSNGVDWKVHSFSANGTLTVNVAGYSEALVVGGGAGGGVPGGGGGVRGGGVWLPAGSQAVTVGGGGAYTAGAGGTAGGASSLGSLLAVGGGWHGDRPAGSGGGGGRCGASGQIASGGAGGSNSGNTPGAGVVSSITGTAVEYGKGTSEGAAAPTLPGQGGWNTAGQAGRVIVRIAV